MIILIVVVMFECIVIVMLNLLVLWIVFRGKWIFDLVILMLIVEIVLVMLWVLIELNNLFLLLVLEISVILVNVFNLLVWVWVVVRFLVILVFKLVWCVLKVLMLVLVVGIVLFFGKRKLCVKLDLIIIWLFRLFRFVILFSRIICMFLYFLKIVNLLFIYVS